MTRQALEKSYTMEEAAAELRICRRMLQDLIGRHPHYHANGRRKLFTETELASLRHAMAREAHGGDLPPVPVPPPAAPAYVEDGLIYFLNAKESQRVKIGFAVNLERRVKELQTGCPEKLTVLRTIPGTRADERNLHKRFAAYRLTGEWFRNAAPLMNYIFKVTR